MNIPSKQNGKMRVLAFGAFDIIHPGHIDFLKSAKKLGDELFVVIAKDSTVKKRKGRNTHFSETIRVQNIEELGIADGVYLGEKEDYLLIPKMIDPDIIALGYDQKAPMKLLDENFSEAIITRLLPHFPEEFKSSKLRNIFPGNSHL